VKISFIGASDVPSNRANSVQILKTCQALIQLGHEVVLYSPRLPGASSPDPSPESLTALYGIQALPALVWIQAVPRWKRYDYAWNAVRAARKWGTELIHTLMLQTAVLGLLLGKPVLLELHGPPEGTIGPHLFRLFLILPGRKRLLLITHGLKHILESSYGNLSGVHPVVHPNGVDLERYAAVQPQILGSTSAIRAVYAGHFYEGRGMELLAELAQRFPQVQFIWVGGQTADVDFWRERLASRDITNVMLTGFIPNADLPPYQAAADILLMPYGRVIRGSSGGDSAAYCSPMKMFEYMACGRAIISSDLPVLHEVLNQRNAVFCTPDDVDSWSQALQQLVDDPELRSRLGNQAREDVQAFTWQARIRAALSDFIEAESE